MQAKAVAHEGASFVNALDGMPLILMSEGGSANEVWKSIQLGAVEYLEKPLSQLKLRNIWQHVVRKVCLLTLFLLILVPPRDSCYTSSLCKLQ